MAEQTALAKGSVDGKEIDQKNVLSTAMDDEDVWRKELVEFEPASRLTGEEKNKKVQM